MWGSFVQAIKETNGGERHETGSRGDLPDDPNKYNRSGPGQPVDY